MKAQARHKLTRNHRLTVTEISMLKPPAENPATLWLPGQFVTSIMSMPENVGNSIQILGRSGKFAMACHTEKWES
jgi:hypothetical protein